MEAHRECVFGLGVSSRGTYGCSETCPHCIHHCSFFSFFPERCSTARRDRRLFIPHCSGPPGLWPMFDVTKKVGYMAPHICQNPQKNTTKSDPDVNYGFGVMTGHCRFISCNKCPIIIWWGCWQVCGGRGTWESLNLCLNFVTNLKLLIKISYKWLRW